MNNIMLDLETMGNSNAAAIVAIGAVRFADGEVTDKFYEVVDLQSSVDAGLTIDVSTILWWMQQDDDARSMFEREGDHIIEVLEKFAEWIGEDAIIWGDGALFDNVILLNAYKKVGIERPWGYRGDRCYRTMKNIYPEIEVKRVGTYHNAVDDAETQALHLMEIFDSIGEK